MSDIAGAVATPEVRLLTLDEAEDITGRFLGEVTV